MFVWFKIIGIEDTNDLIKKEAVNEKVLLVPGVSFTPNSTFLRCDQSYFSSHFSGTFSVCESIFLYGH